MNLFQWFPSYNLTLLFLQGKQIDQYSYNCCNWRTFKRIYIIKDLYYFHPLTINDIVLIDHLKPVFVLQKDKSEFYRLITSKYDFKYVPNRLLNFFYYFQ